jgi:hypothetical protein
MSNKGLLASVAAAALTAVGTISQASASVAIMPGTPEPPTTAGALLDPFKMIFDENGNAIIAIYDPATGEYGDYTILKPLGGAPFLTWTLPQLVSARGCVVRRAAHAGMHDRFELQ